jgi:hypothetical protein
MVGFTHKWKQIFKKFVKKETIIYGKPISIAHYYYLCKDLAICQQRYYPSPSDSRKNNSFTHFTEMTTFIEK